MNKNNEALKDIKLSLALSPSVEALRTRGRIYMRMKSFKLAIHAFKESLELLARDIGSDKSLKESLEKELKSAEMADRRGMSHYEILGNIYQQLGGSQLIAY